MDDQSFAPGTPEAELAEKATVLMGGNALKNKRGHLLITNDRVVFSDQRFDPFPMSDITRVSHVKKLTVRDILVIEAGGDEHRFSEGYATIASVLRRALTERHGRVIQDDGAEAWHVTA
jgi:hypothetical protein